MQKVKAELATDLQNAGDKSAQRMAEYDALVGKMGELDKALVTLRSGLCVTKKKV